MAPETPNTDLEQFMGIGTAYPFKHAKYFACVWWKYILSALLITIVLYYLSWTNQALSLMTGLIEAVIVVICAMIAYFYQMMRRYESCVWIDGREIWYYETLKKGYLYMGNNGPRHFVHNTRVYRLRQPVCIELSHRTVKLTGDVVCTEKKYDEYKGLCVRASHPPTFKIPMCFEGLEDVLYQMQQ